MRVTLRRNLLRIIIPFHTMLAHAGMATTSPRAEFLSIVSEILKSPTFQIESPRAGAVLECAKYIQSAAEQKVLVSFCDNFYACLEKLCTDVQKSRLSYSAQRIKLMTLFHQKRTADLLKM